MKVFILTILSAVSLLILTVHYETNDVMANGNKKSVAEPVQFIVAEKCAIVREKRGTRCGSSNSLEITVSVADYCTKRSSDIDVYTKSNSNSEWSRTDGFIVHKGTPISTWWCKEPYQYQVKEN